MLLGFRSDYSYYAYRNKVKLRNLLPSRGLECWYNKVFDGNDPMRDLDRKISSDLGRNCSFRTNADCTRQTVLPLSPLELPTSYRQSAGFN
jgi:hypothetical protein